ncbi:FAD-binding protein [Neptunicoccus cionae]|uniref:Decaprenylphosphoryl-beta-D-ribose oxidase n=1 Tax=Neptunicoccus cionae TaxID=2035344 RepID=A0A916QUK3_9RHOB|nr:FAD-binding oxidoreductase [Amylibacter cionae]GGA14206.1 decaprenylphosphoryl-beta-D-ribose oxidase [Amylibacter cionae]
MRWKTAELTGWGRVLTGKAELARPEKPAALSQILKKSPAPAIGAQRSYGDAAVNGNGRAIDMTRLDRFISFDPETGILHAEAGCSITDMLDTFAPQGWMPAVMPGTGFATLGGCIAHDVHGKNHHKAGTFGQHVVAVDLMGADGSTKTITPESDPALFKATIGGLGQTGAIVSAKIKMIPCSSRLIQVDERRAANLVEFMEMLKASNATYCVGWIDGTANGQSLGRGILEEAELTSSNMAPKRRKPRKVPFNAPKFALSPPTVRLFNRMYFNRIPKQGRGVLRSLKDFFFPLDKIHDWNKLYGKRGFHQFQCVLPDETAERTLRDMLRLIADAGLASPLAVLKRTGAGRAGLLSFPMEGFTLALDFPNSEKSRALVAQLNALAAEAGGRIYFAKDSLATAAQARQMYPELAEWQKTVEAADPEGAFKTDLIRRLKLRTPA